MWHPYRLHFFCFLSHMIRVGFWAIKQIHTYFSSSHAHPKTYWSLILNLNVSPEALRPLCAIYCFPQISAFHSYILWIAEHSLDVFIEISIIIVWSCSWEVKGSSDPISLFVLPFFFYYCHSHIELQQVTTYSGFHWIISKPLINHGPLVLKYSNA